MPEPEDMVDKADTASNSESENPAIDSPEPETGGRPRSNQDWWPNQLDLSVLHQHQPRANPLGDHFDYRAAFADLDVAALKQDLVDVRHDSHDSWPAARCNYGPFITRVTVHTARNSRMTERWDRGR